MSYTFTLSGHSSELSSEFYPPIDLSTTSKYGLALLGFYTYNSIFNVDESNNCFGFSKSVEGPYDTIRIPPGAYEISIINNIIQDALKSTTKNKNDNIFSLYANNNTLKCEIQSTLHLNLNYPNSIAQLIGFEKKIYEKNLKHVSSLPVNSMKVRIIRVDCNITSGAYINSEASHTIFEFDIDVEPGYKLSKEPTNIIYLPVIPESRQFIDNITLRIVDDNGNLINFRGEKIIIKLELRKLV